MNWNWLGLYFDFNSLSLWELLLMFENDFIFLKFITRSRLNWFSHEISWFLRFRLNILFSFLFYTWYTCYVQIVWCLLLPHFWALVCRLCYSITIISESSIFLSLCNQEDRLVILNVIHFSISFFRWLLAVTFYLFECWNEFARLGNVLVSLIYKILVVTSLSAYLCLGVFQLGCLLIVALTQLVKKIKNIGGHLLILLNVLLSEVLALNHQVLDNQLDLQVLLIHSFTQ